MKINWIFVLGGAVIVVNSIVALADFLQGGLMWTLLLLTVGAQTLAVLGVLK